MVGTGGVSGAIAVVGKDLAVVVETAGTAEDRPVEDPVVASTPGEDMDTLAVVVEEDNVDILVANKTCFPISIPESAL